MSPTASTASRLLQRVPALGLLKDRDFALTWSSESGLWIGRSLEWTVLALLVHDLTGSPFKVSLVMVFYWAPMPVLSVLSGAIADRLERWRLLVIAHATVLVVAAVLLALILAGQIQPWHVFIAALVLGLGMALDWPARNGFMCDLAGAENIDKAMSVDSVGLASGLLIGPAIGGLLVQTVGFEGPFVLLLIIYSATLIMISAVKSRVRPSQTSRESVATSLRIGLRESLRNRVILGLLAATVIMDLLAFSAVGLFPVVGREHLEVSYGLTGLLASSQGIGMMVGTLGFMVVLAVLKAIRYQGRAFGMACAVWLVCILIFALSPWYSLSFLILMVSGLAMGVYTPLQRTIILTVAGPQMQGRVIGVLGTAIGAVIVGSLIVGAVAEAVGAPTAIAINAGVGLLLLIPVLALTPLASQPIVRGAGRPPAAAAAVDQGAATDANG